MPFKLFYPNVTDLLIEAEKADDHEKICRIIRLKMSSVRVLVLKSKYK